MASVTQMIKKTKQPRGGFVNPKMFAKELQFCEEKLYDQKLENVHPILVGLAVDYLTRFKIGTSLNNSFQISLLGATLIEKNLEAEEILNKINISLDDKSIINSLKLVSYDVIVRAGSIYYKGPESVLPNKETIENVRIMVKRSLIFFKKYGPVVSDGFTFEGGYTSKIEAGDGDFLTKDTLWDFKVSKNEITKDHTLQLLIYYLMGIKSVHNEFKYIEKLGIWNPRLSLVYLLDINLINDETIDFIKKEIIGY